MPKIKTKKAIAKRVKVTGSGRLLRNKAFSGCTHIRSNKSNKQVRGYRKSTLTHPSDEKRIKPAIPYM